MRAAKVAERAALIFVPTRTYWATARIGGCTARHIVGAEVRSHQKVVLSSLSGQRRWLSDEKKQEKKQERAGLGVLATFIKSVRDQMSSRAETDEELAAAQERLEKARLESIVKAEAAMRRAKEAAEEARTSFAFLHACTQNFEFLVPFS